MSPPQEPIGGTPADDLWESLGFPSFKKPAEEEEDPGMLSSLLSGVGRGLGEPLTMIPSVRERMEFLNRYRGNDLRDKISYGLGWLASSLLPVGLAYKIGGKVVMSGSKLVKGAGLLRDVERAGQTAVELSRIGKVVRGGIAGAIYTAGQEADDLEQWVGNVGMNAALFGVGDVVVPGVLNATISSARALGRVFRPANKAAQPEVVAAVQQAISTGLRVRDSKIMGRALSIIDDIIEKEPARNADEIVSLAERRMRMQFGLERMYLEEVDDGLFKIIPAVEDVDDITKILTRLPDIEHRVVKRGSDTDIVVGMAGQLDDKVIAQYEKDGFIEGMEILWNTRKRIIKGADPKKPGNVLAWDVNSLNMGTTSIPLKDAHLLPLVHSPSNTIASNALSPLWRDWIQFVIQTNSEGRFLKEGQAPAGVIGEVVDAFPDDFTRAFNAFAKERKLVGGAKLELHAYFKKRYDELLREVDPELSEVLENIARHSQVSARTVHPEGSLAAQASEKGFLLDWMPEEGTKNWIWLLINQKSGQVHRFVTDKSGHASDAIDTFLKNYHVDPGDMLPGFDPGLPMGSISAGNGVGVQIAHGAGLLENFKARAGFLFTSSIRPRYAVIRSADDQLLKQNITHVEYIPPGSNVPIRVPISYWAGSNGRGGFFNIDRGQVLQRNEMYGKYAPDGILKRAWVPELIKMRGSAYELKSIRQEGNILDKWWDVFILPPAEWAEKSALYGLTKEEAALVPQLRKYYNDLFDRLQKGQSGPKLTGDEFIETYLNMARYSRESDWSKLLEGALSLDQKSKNEIVSKMVEEARATGTIGTKTRDPFALAMQVTRQVFYRLHVKDHWDSTFDMVKHVKAWIGPPDAQLADPSRIMVQRINNSMEEYLLMVRGLLPEVYEAMNAGTHVLFSQLGVKLSPLAFDRFVNTLVSLNYGAFMGFRLGQPVRNMSQMLVTTLPRVGPVNLTKALETTFGGGISGLKALYERGRKIGLLSESTQGVAMDDVVYMRESLDIAQTVLPESQGGKRVKKLTTLAARATGLSNFSLFGFGKSDELLRIVSFLAQEYKAIRAINNGKKLGWTQQKIDEEIGLLQFGEAVRTEFHRRATVNQDDAIEFLAKTFADDTQYIYRIGAGPAMFSHGAGRLFGMYGTWPLWYAEHLQRGARIGSRKDRLKFMGYTAAVHAAFANAVYITGVNLNRWTGLSSFEFGGGPYFDWFKNATTIWSGVQDDGMPTAGRTLALSRMGLRDVGPEGADENVLRSILSGLPGAPGQIAMKSDARGTPFKNSGPYRLFEQTIGAFTPGMYFIRDALDTSAQIGDGKYGEAVIEALGLKTAGSDYPGFRIRM